MSQTKLGKSAHREWASRKEWKVIRQRNLGGTLEPKSRIQRSHIHTYDCTHNANTQNLIKNAPIIRLSFKISDPITTTEIN